MSVQKRLVLRESEVLILLDTLERLSVHAEQLRSKLEGLSEYDQLTHEINWVNRWAQMVYKKLGVDASDLF